MTLEINWRTADEQGRTMTTTIRGETVKELEKAYRLAQQWLDLHGSTPAESDAETVDHLMALTPRETQVLELLRQGLTFKEIARKLVVAPSTVDSHVKHINSKLGTRAVRQMKRVAVLGPDDKNKQLELFTESRPENS